MIYYDDILNVNAYLRSKSRANIEASKRLAKEYERLGCCFDELNEHADDVLARAYRFANSIGVNINQQCNSQDLGDDGYIDCTDLLVKLPKDIDFSVEFEKLKIEARKHGYVDVHPDDLLSAEEIQRANEFSNQLDERFKQETGLTNKDITVLVVATAIRVVCYFLFSHIMSDEEAIESNETNNATRQNTKYSFDAMSGMDLATLVNSAKDISSAIPWSGEMGHPFGSGKTKLATIKIDSQIIEDTIPFDIPDNSLFLHNDILGFDSFLGWIFGVMNIMTDTVTTRKMESFSISRMAGTSGTPNITKKISTPLHLIYPLIADMPKHKESFLAAVVREAQVLNIANGSTAELRRILQHTMKLEEKNQFVLDSIEKASDGLALPVKEIAVHLAHTVFIDQLITAIHAIQYNPSTDGDIALYTIRTNKILAISSGMAALLDSIPTLVFKDISKLDFAGIIATCLSVFRSTRFWIEVKTNYLVSEYKIQIDKELSRIDRFFEIE